MSDAPRFYTTKVDARKSANEIGDLVSGYGARSFGVTFDDKRRPISLHFVMAVPDVGDVPVELRAQVDALATRLSDASRTYRDREEYREMAFRIAWRQLKAYVEMMLEMVENGLKPFHEAFMADVMLHVGAGQYRRLGDAYREAGGRLALPAPQGEVIDADFEEVG